MYRVISYKRRLNIGYVIHLLKAEFGHFLVRKNIIKFTAACEGL